MPSETQGGPVKLCAFVVPFLSGSFATPGSLLTAHSRGCCKRLKALLFASGVISAKEGIDCEMDPSLRQDGVGVGIWVFKSSNTRNL